MIVFLSVKLTYMHTHALIVTSFTYCYTYLAAYLLCLNLLVYHNTKEHACTVLVSVEEEANHFLGVNPVSLNLYTTRKSYFNFELVMTLFSAAVMATILQQFVHITHIFKYLLLNKNRNSSELHF